MCTGYVYHYLRCGVETLVVILRSDCTLGAVCFHRGAVWNAPIGSYVSLCCHSH